MAFMIPESIVPTAPEADRLTFDFLRRSLPSSCTVWYKTALELEDDQQVPFLALGEEIGIVVITPLDWPLLGYRGSLSLFWQSPKAPQISKAERLKLETIEREIENFRQLLLDSRMAELVTPAGTLRPAFHKVYLLLGLKGKEVTQLKLRVIVEDALVLAKDEVDQLHNILRQHTPASARLTGDIFNTVRLVVSPSIQVRIHMPSPPTTELAGRTKDPVKDSPQQMMFTLDIQQEQIVKSYAHIRQEDKSLARNLDTRLIRGVVGSGKSLILLHRAHYLSQLYPEKKILLLTYNRSLADFLTNRLKDLPQTSGNIEIINFHAWCRKYLSNADVWRNTALDDQSRKGLLAHLQRSDTPNTKLPEHTYLLEEFDWIRDQGFTEREKYETASRTGREKRLLQSQRRQVWGLLDRYRRSMRKHRQFDWPEVPLMMLEAIEKGRIPTQIYHAILVDEAQDFAPSWFAVVQKMLQPTTNMLFLAADAAQKIYRRPVSWRQLGINVTGRRSRILKHCYRSTYDILQTAFEVINDPSVREAIASEEGDLIEPDLDQTHMRRGPLPIILQFTDPTREFEYISQEIKKLKANGLAWNDIAVICRDSKTLGNLVAFLRSQEVPALVAKGMRHALASQDVKLLTLHSSKGLEFIAVFITGVERLQPRPGLSEEDSLREEAESRRLLYVGMTRARSFLYITHCGPLPNWLLSSMTAVEDHNLAL